MHCGVEVKQWDTTGYEAPDVCGECPDEWECETCANHPASLPTRFVVEVADDLDDWQYYALDAVTESTGWCILDATVRPLR